MKQIWIALLLLGLALGSARAADETVRAVQKRLKQDGFYYGDATGVYYSATAAAVTRYQICHGLSISGRLDQETTQALGVAQASTGETAPSPVAGTWRRLRNGDMQFLKALNAGKIPPPQAPTSTPARAASPAGTTTHTALKAKIDAHGPPPRLPEEQPSPAAPRPETAASPGSQEVERLRDYVAAFVLAGLDPKVSTELEFFADRVNYFGEKNVSRPKIGRDLARYDERWPERSFRLAGELRVTDAGSGRLRVSFPLRYELRRGARHASGEVMKTLTLRRTGADDFEIVAVDERKLRP